MSNAVYGAKAAALFAKPLPYSVFNCTSWTEQQVLTNAACAHGTRNTVFITLANAQHVTFGENGHYVKATFKTFGVSAEPFHHDTVLYLPSGAFPRPPLPPGVHPVSGPLRFGMLGVDGDPFDLEAGECLTA